MTNIFFTSDTHFNHESIIEFCSRPYKTVDEMNEDIIRKWNNTVKKNDKVYHLGDFGFGDKKEITNIVNKLNGNISLIKGNHDTHSNQWYRDCGFKEVYDFPIVIKEFILLSHEPLPFSISKVMVNLYGHVHNSLMFETWGKQSVCVCTERHDYKPINYNEIENYFVK